MHNPKPSVYTRWSAANITTSSFPTVAPTATAPAAAVSVTHQKTLEIIPFGTDAADKTFSIRIIGWRVGASGLYVPLIIAELQATLCTAVGVAAKDVINTEYFADAITKTTGTATLLETTANTVCRAQVSLEGFISWQATFTTGSSATGCNLLYCTY